MSQSQEEKQRITVHINRALLVVFDQKLKKIFLRRDAYLNHTLPGEVDDLENIEKNTEKGAKYLRQIRGAMSDKARVALTLDKFFVERMNKVCIEKGVVRDNFIENYITFLVLGDHENGTCVSPLDKIRVLIDHPRTDYEGPNPYEGLTLSDDEVDYANKSMQDILKVIGAIDHGK